MNFPEVMAAKTLTRNGQRWAVVGGGLLGMTVAHTLAKAGRQVTLFEASDVIGGLASTWKIGDVTWDRYYHVTLYSDTVLRSLLTELNLGQFMHWKQTKTAFYHRGRLLPFSNAIDFARFPILGPVGKMRLAATILYASRFRDWQRLESISVEDWLMRLSGRDVFEKIWQPLLRSKLGEDYKTTSATFIWATIQRMYAARRNGLKEERFGHLQGGLARMLGAYQLALSGLGIEIRLSSPIEDIRATDGGKVCIRARGQSCETFARVIVTTPPAIASKVCFDLTERERNELANVPYLGIVCTSVLLRRAVSDYYITNILDQRIPFTGLIEMTALVNKAEFGDRHLLYIPHYVRPDHPDFDRNEDELSAEATRTLKQMYPTLTDDDFLAVRISRTRYVFPRPVTIDGPRRTMGVDTSVPGLNIVNSSHIVNGTLNINETVALAQREARRIHVTFQ